MAFNCEVATILDTVISGVFNRYPQGHHRPRAADDGICEWRLKSIDDECDHTKTQ